MASCLAARRPPAKTTFFAGEPDSNCGSGLLQTPQAFAAKWMRGVLVAAASRCYGWVMVSGANLALSLQSGFLPLLSLALLLRR